MGPKATETFDKVDSGGLQGTPLFKKQKVTYFEDNTGAIRNDAILIKFNYTFTNPLASEIDYTQERISSKTRRQR